MESSTIYFVIKKNMKGIFKEGALSDKQVREVIGGHNVKIKVTLPDGTVIIVVKEV